MQPRRMIPRRKRMTIPNEFDPWRLFSEMCKIVVEEQNVFLDVLITNQGIEMMLMPTADDEYD